MNHLGQSSLPSSQHSSNEKTSNALWGIWNDELVEKLIDLWGKGLSATETAKELGCVTRNSVIGKVHRLGLKREKIQRFYGRPNRKPREAAPRPKPKPVLRIVRSGYSSGMRVHQSAVIAPPKLRAVEIDPLHITLDQLERCHCRYPYGDGPFTFCGHPKQDDSSYCAAHRGLCRYEERSRG